MLYEKDERVINKNVPDWGVGKVIEVSGNYLKIFFVGVGEKTMPENSPMLKKVVGSQAANPLLDNLKIIERSNSKKYVSFPASIKRFLSNYPKGFYDDEFVEIERDYKIEACKLMVELLSKDKYKALLQANDYNEICVRALKIVNKTNLIFPNEKMSLKDGLETDHSKKIFAEKLFNLLFSDEMLERRFVEFSEVLFEINAAKWTTATYFQYILYPSEFLFMKPSVTKAAADMCAFELNYKPELNWLTYKSLMKFASYLKTELKDLNPRDMIDVQTFIWWIAQ